MVGGRPKVPGLNRKRDWRIARVCLCPKGVHIPLPEDWKDCLDAQHNPQEPTWPTVCPLNMFAVIQGLLPRTDKGRSYPCWLRAQQRWSDRDLGHDKLVPLARTWLNIQGGNPDQLLFCSNSGRKSLGKWCSELKIKYSVSHQIHGDLWSTWQRFYQPTLLREPEYTDREQSQNIDVMTEGLRRFARFLGRGRGRRDDPQQISQQQFQSLMTETLRALNKSDVVARILDRMS